GRAWLPREVQGPAADERGEGFRPRGDPAAEVRKVAVRPVALAPGQDARADLLRQRGDGVQADADGPALRGERPQGPVDARQAQADRGTLDRLDVDPPWVH